MFAGWYHVVNPLFVCCLICHKLLYCTRLLSSLIKFYLQLANIMTQHPSPLPHPFPFYWSYQLINIYEHFIGDKISPVIISMYYISILPNMAVFSLLLELDVIRLVSMKSSTICSKLVIKSSISDLNLDGVIITL